MRVLIADDDRLFVTINTAAFTQRGWTVDAAFDAMQALMHATRTPAPDVVLLDLSMPAGSGYHTLARLHASSRTAAIPVVIITGSTEADARARTEALGAVRFLKKPIPPDDLAAVLLDVVKASKPGAVEAAPGAQHKA